MDGLGLALFGIFLVSFTVSKPVVLYQKCTASSSESSESNESSSSEEATEPKPTLRPTELNTLGQDSLHQTNNPTAQPGLPQTTLDPSLTGQEVVEEYNLTITYVVPVLDAERVVALDVPTPERGHPVLLTTPEPKPARGDNM